MQRCSSAQCQLCQLSGPGESLPAEQHTCCGLIFWILLSCRGWSISISFVCSLAEGAGILKRGGLGLVPNLSAITSLNTFCGSVQDMWSKIIVKPSQRSVESISISMLNQFCSLSVLVFLPSLRAANIAKVSDEQSFPETALVFLGAFGSEDALTKWLIFVTVPWSHWAWEARHLWDPGCFCASAYLTVYPRLCIGSSTKINLRMEIVCLGWRRKHHCIWICRSTAKWRSTAWYWCAHYVNLDGHSRLLKISLKETLERKSFLKKTNLQLSCIYS